MSVAYKVESGLQMLARLSKKRDVDKFYPLLFESGLKQGEVVEIFGKCNTGKTFLVMDLIVQALIPIGLGGAETEVLIFHTDGNMKIELLLSLLKQTLHRRVETTKACVENINKLFMDCCNRFHCTEIYDATQLYVTIHNLDNIFTHHPNISLLVFDTLTAYYWTEQGTKLTKMDLYLKNILKLIQKATKDYRSTIVYTRQEYFNTSKESIENLEACCELPTSECINYRIHLSLQDSNHQVTLRSYKYIMTKVFRILNCQLEWI